MTEPTGVPVVFNVPPNDLGSIAVPGYLADTPDNRKWLETLAIPRCQEWREANWEQCCDEDDCSLAVAAPYCCSAYCPRCAGLRALNGDDRPLLPNEWMQP